MKISGLIGNFVTLGGSGWEVWDPAGAAKCIMLTILILPSTGLTIWYAERAIDAEYWGMIPQYTVALSLSVVTHWFSPHHHHHLLLQQLHLPSSSYPEKEEVEPCLDCHYASFPIRSLGFLELFSNSPLSAFCPPLMRSSLPPGHQENYLIWVDSSLMATFS